MYLSMYDTCADQSYNGRMINTDKQAYYIIRVEGHLDTLWNGWFGDMRISHLDEPQCVTVLSGHIANQTELHNVLSKIRDLGLPLIAIDRILQGEIETHAQPAHTQE